MQYTVSTASLSTQYIYTFDDNTHCTFTVNTGGVIYINIRETIPFVFLCSALNEVTDMTIQKGLTPKININNSTTFLKILAKKCGYQKIPSQGISFSVWVRPSENALR